MPKKRILTGSSNFRELAAPDVLYIDKTLLIKDIINDGAKAILLPRPRRWGKTLNMDMLQHFFAPRVYGQATAQLFDHLKISETDGGKYMAHQGQYPVIFLSLKGTKGNNLEEVQAKVGSLVSELFNQHAELYVSDKLSPLMKARYSTILEEKATLPQIEESLATLSQCLWEHHRRKVYILIDEYDVPLNHAYNKPYFQQVVGLMRNFLGAGLKDNPYLEKGLLTGILRIAKANIFSELNNLEEYTLLDPGYNQHFGFTEQEIGELLNPGGGGESPVLKGNLREIHDWYNGYSIGGTTIYNPWSIMNYIKKGRLAPYWIETGGSNQLITDTITNASFAIKEQLMKLMQGEAIEVSLSKYTTYDNLTTNPTAFWSLLFNAGYLTIHEIKKIDGTSCDCSIKIPNQEIASLYRRVFKNLIATASTSDNFVEALIAGDVEKFIAGLRRYLQESVSYHDLGTKKDGKGSEQLYHNLISGMMVGTFPLYQPISNRESGEGRYDIILMPKSKNALGIILEFKSITKKSTSVALGKSAQEALRQIKENNYEVELEKQQIANKLLIGIAFAGKQLAYKHEKILAPEFNSQAQITAYRASQDEFTLTPPSSPTVTATSAGYREREYQGQDIHAALLGLAAVKGNPNIRIYKTQMTENLFIASLEQYRQELQSEGLNIGILQIHGNHWVSVLFDNRPGQPQKILYIDPTGAVPGEKLTRAIQTWFPDIAITYSEENFQMTHLDIGDEYISGNVRNCGVWVVKLTELYIQLDQLARTQDLADDTGVFDIKAERKRQSPFIAANTDTVLALKAALRGEPADEAPTAAGKRKPEGDPPRPKKTGQTDILDFFKKPKRSEASKNEGDRGDNKKADDMQGIEPPSRV